MEALFHVLEYNIIPIFLLIAAGFMLSKKFDIDIFTLSKLNFYLFVPAFMLVNLYTTPIDMAMVKVLGFSIFMLAANYLLAEMIAWLGHYDVGLANAFRNTIMFNNCGNIGVSLITLVFTSEPFIIDGKTPYFETAMGAIVVILILQNLTMNTLGFYYAGKASFTARESIKKIVQMPTIYVIPAMAFLKLVDLDIKPTFIWPALVYLKDGLVPIALVTLGVQLSKTAFQFNNKVMHISVFNRLVVGPVLAIVGVYIFGFTGVIAQAVFIAYAVPTAVNVALIAVEYNNFPAFSTQAVMASTVFSTVTLTFVIYLARVIYPV